MQLLGLPMWLLNFRSYEKQKLYWVRDFAKRRVWMCTRIGNGQLSDGDFHGHWNLVLQLEQVTPKEQNRGGESK